MQGTVTSDLEAVVRLMIRGTGGTEIEIKTILDTGFDSYLTLPPSLIQALALPYRGRRKATLADGSQIILDVYRVTVIWNGRPRAVAALEAAGGALIGMLLMHGCVVTLHVVDGGRVTIQP
jgi:clan AA aspartic protease